MLWLLVLFPAVALSSEIYEERLLIRRLASEHLLAKFSFEFQVDRLDGNYDVWPKVLGDVSTKYGVGGLKLSLTQGHWRTPQWGFAPQPAAPTGGLVRAHFTQAEGDVNERWRNVVHTLSGLFCASLSQMVPTLSGQPLFPQHNNYTTVFGLLPSEGVCTENLTPWKKLLPCKDHGLITLLNPIKLYEANYHSLSVDLRKSCQGAASDCPWTLKLGLVLVFDVPLQTKNRGWTLRDTFDSGLYGQCALAERSEILVFLGDEASGVLCSRLPTVLSQEASFTPAPTSSVASPPPSGRVATFDLRALNLSRLRPTNIACAYERARVQLGGARPPPVRVHSFVAGVGQVDGRLVSRLANDLPHALPIRFAHVVPSFLRVFVHTLRVDCAPTSGGELRRDALHVRPSRLRARPLQVELELTLPARAVCELSVQFERAFLRWNEYPPDAHRGHFVPSPLVTFELDGLAPNVSFPLVASGPRQLRVLGEAVLVLLPTPDFSMPYNVICLVCTVVALCFGPIHNLTTKTFVLRDPDELKKKSIRSRVVAVVLKLKQRVNRALGRATDDATTRPMTRDRLVLCRALHMAVNSYGEAVFLLPFAPQTSVLSGELGLLSFIPMHTGGSSFIQFHSVHSCAAYLTSEQTFDEAIFRSGNFVPAVAHLTSSLGCDAYVLLYHSRSDYLNPQTIFLNGAFAAGLGLRENSTVEYRFVECVDFCERITVEPLSADDWEIVESNAEFLEEQFLQQLSVVQTGKVYPLWVVNIVVYFRVVDAGGAKQVCRLTEDSEVAVAPVVRAADSDSAVKATSQSRRTSRPVSGGLPADLGSSWLDRLTTSSRLFHRLASDAALSLRVLPREFVAVAERTHPNVAFASPSVLTGLAPLQSRRPLFCAARLSRSLVVGEKGDRAVRSCVALLVVLPAVLPPSVRPFVQAATAERLRRSPGHVILPPCCAASLGAADLTRVRLHLLHADAACLSAVVQLSEPPIALPTENQSPAAAVSERGARLCQLVRANTSDDWPLMLSSDFATIFEGFSATFEPPSTAFEVGIFLPSTRLAVTTTRRKSDHAPVQVDGTSSDIACPYTKTVLPRLFDQVSEQVLKWARRLRARSNSDGHLLVVGPSSSSKTTLLKSVLCDAYHSDAIYCCHIDCALLRGKKVDTVLRRVRECLERCAERRPALLLLDDLDELCSAPSAADQLAPGAAVVGAQLANGLRSLIETVCGGEAVGVLATAASRQSIHADLVAPRGRRLFSSILDMPLIDLDGRLELLQLMLADSTAGLTELARKTDGFSVGDLSKLAQRAKFSAARRRQGDAAITVEECDLVEAMEKYRPLAQRHADVNKERLTKTWADIGGLAEARRLLTETLIWPAKYPKVYAKCPIRLARGVLLYGPSGTGKTLLASVVAHESALNFISVKGPELLSKYIGASEQNVRDLFQRARSCTPSLIFFDEFDALAPRRGHDSTGVTDRVVNQLLTELDGFDELNGVFVLAATNRRDLIDPAILRPGRIDQMLYCGLPDTEERNEIIKTIASRLTLTDEFASLELAERTAGLTGADLNAIFCDAQFHAISRLHGAAEMAISSVDLDSALGDFSRRRRQTPDRDIEPDSAPMRQRATLA